MPTFITDLPAELRAAPPWALIVGAVIAIILLLGTLPFAGWMIERKRRKEYANMRLSGFHGDDFFADQPDRQETLRVPSTIGRPQKFGALDVTFANQPTATLLGLTDSSPTTVIPEYKGPKWMPEVDEFDDETQWGLDDEELAEDTSEPDEPETQPVISIEEDKSYWETEPTGSWSVIEEWEAELKDSEAAALAAFREDPLGAWYVPPAVIADSVKSTYLPEADRAFSAMFLGGRLTGVGADIDARWKSWNLELEGAAR